ncbi:GAF domain-containing sensor histidine kinase [Desulfocurvus sp. DL9XJH121]
MEYPLSDTELSAQDQIPGDDRPRRSQRQEAKPCAKALRGSEARELAHLRKINRIQRVVRPGGDLNETMNQVVEEVRDVFDADQVILVHPCLSAHGSLRIAFSSSRPGVPAPPYAPNEDVSATREVAQTHRQLLLSKEPLVTGPGSPYTVPEQVAKDLGVRTAMITALYPREDDPWMLAVHQCSHERVWSEDEVRLLKDIAQIMAAILWGVLLAQGLEDSRERMQTLSAQLFRAQEEEHKKFAREIHDDLGQPLVAIKVGLDNALYDLPEDSHLGLKRWLVSAAGLAKSLVDRVRMMQDAMYPATLQDFGLLLALDAFINNYQKIYPGLMVNKVVLVQEEDIPETLGVIIFRIVQEALYNAAKHSGGDAVSVALERRDQRLRLAVRDNGQGFDLSEAAPCPGSLTGLGLPSMRERAEITGGAFSIHSAPGKGTFIQIEWPLPRD